MKHVPGLALLVAFLAWAPCGPAAAEEAKIHECTNAQGEVVYQDGPCVEAVPARPKHRAAPKPPPAAPKPPPPAPRARPRPPELPPPEGPVDARWSTPEKTLKTFVAAVTAGDRPLIWACLTTSARADLGPNADAIPLESLRELVGSFTGYATEGDLGPVWSIRAKRAGQRPKWIFFERTRAGDWRIAAI